MSGVSATAACLALAFYVVACTPAGQIDDAVFTCGHLPQAPRSGETVRVTAEVLPEITHLDLELQIVDPGAYIELDSRAFNRKWERLPMRAAADPALGGTRTRFEIELPGDLQIHRRLIRYRFRGQGTRERLFAHPPPDSEPPNFAYFVYDGVPAWSGSVEPRGRDSMRRAPVTYPSSALNRVQTYHLIGNAGTIDKIAWKEPRWDRDYRYTATLVVDGVVHDHVKVRARGGVWRYEMGKNMWKFNLPKGRRLAARDDYGRPYEVSWDKVNLRSCIQQGDYGYRGEQGMFEAVGFRLFNLAGVPAPFTHWVQLRIITGPEESPADQYRGDFWGLYLAIEEVEDRFLKAHHLPDGNLYKMEQGFGVLSNHGKNAVDDSSDLAAFLHASRRPSQPETWWRSNLDLPGYYSYRAICEAIHHYDIGDGKNYFYYHNPLTDRWQVFPWDIDLTWADTMYGHGEEPFKRRALSHPALQRDYLNRLREIRDLLYNPDETDRLIDECAAVIADPQGGVSPVHADRAKWDFHPMMSRGAKAGHGLFYRKAPSRDFQGMVQLMKDYVRHRSAWIDRVLLSQVEPPSTPAIHYTGASRYPPDRLTFRISPFQGTRPFAALQWRLAEIAPPPTSQGRPTSPGKYEITALWESDMLDRFDPDFTLPPALTQPGRTYRVRARVKDDEGHWSHWSPPVELTPVEDPAAP